MEWTGQILKENGPGTWSLPKFDAINVIDDDKFADQLSLVHIIPLIILAIITIIDIPEQRFYQFNTGCDHMSHVSGTYYMLILSLFY